MTQAREVTRGNLAARVEPGRFGQDEIGQISLAFNRMAESLQARRAERDAALRRADEERILLHLVLNSMSEGVIAIDDHERFLMVNSGARQLYTAAPEPGSSFHAWRSGHQMLALDDALPCELADGPLMQALRGASLDNWVRLLCRPGQKDRILRVNCRPLRDAGSQLFGAVAVMSDITELKAAEVFAASQQQVMALIAAEVPLRQLLEAIVRLIEQSTPGSLCSILFVRDQQLRHGAAASLPAGFVQAIDGLAVAEVVGACGTAAFRKTSVMVGDAMRDPLMQAFRGLLEAHGLRACWSTPVTSSDGEVLATFAIYRRSAGLPQARDVSPAYQKIWGRTCQSLYAEPGSYARAAVAEDRPLLALAHKRNRAGESARTEYRILKPAGQMRWIRGQSYLVFNAAGELERVVGTARDISASKHADLALSRTYRALQMLSRSGTAINRINDEAGLLAEICRVAVDVGG
ncbi:MAG: PAS domain-containing protein [Polaromonas sp.]